MFRIMRTAFGEELNSTQAFRKFSECRQKERDYSGLFARLNAAAGPHKAPLPRQCTLQGQTP